jgi:hypothetical protein
LEFNPLHDAAGSYHFTLHAATAAGQSDAFDIQVVVADNPALAETHWKDPVDGNWSDATKWSSGLPAAGIVAVIDAVGSYTVNVDTAVTTAGIVLNQSNAVLQTTTDVNFNAPFELRAGQFNIFNSPRITLNSVLANRDRLHWISTCHVFNLQGSGRIENLGLFEVFQDTACNNGSESFIEVPLNVGPTGKFQVSSNALVAFSTPVTLTVAGQLEIQPGGRLRMDGAQVLNLMAGSGFASAGTLRLDNNGTIQLNQDTTLPGDWQLSGNATVSGFGSLSVPDSHSMRGTFSVPLQLLANSVVNFNTSAINSNLTVLPGAVMTVNNNTVLQLNSTLTNYGTISFVSGCNIVNLQGPGHAENFGLWKYFQDTACNNGSESFIQVPVNVAVGGKLLLDTNALVDISSSVNLTVAGALELRSGARLRLDNSQTVNLLSGSSFTGPGTLRLDSSSRMMLNQDTTLPGDLQMSGNAAVIGVGNLLVPGTHSFAGNFSVPLELLPGAVVNFNTFSVNSNLTVDAGGTMTINTSTTIGLDSTLTNFGTLHWVSGCNIFNLQGPGRVENFGLWEIFQDTACFNGSESFIQVPVDVAAGGKLLLSTNAQVDLSNPITLTVAGQLEIQSGVRLRMDGSQTITLLAGSTMTGSGTIRLDGSSRLVVPGDLDSTVSVFMNSGAAQLIVPGQYTVRGNSSLQGLVNSAAVEVTSNATLSASSASFTGQVQLDDGATLQTTSGTLSFGSNVLVAAGALWELPTSTAIQLTGVLTNFGTLHWVSGCDIFNLTGPGHVENFGLWEIFGDTRCFNGSESFIQVPVDVLAGSQFLISTNGRVDLAGPSSLSSAGQLQIQTGGQLRLESAQSVTLLSGSVATGAGTLRFDSSTRLDLPSDVTLGISQVNFFANSGIAGSNLLTISAGSLILFDHSSTFSGSVTIDGGLTLNNSSATLTIAGTLTLDQSGVITNAGTVRVGAFVNNGGTIVGNAPVLIGAGQVAQITSIRLSYSASSIPNSAVAGAGSCQVVLSCRGPVGQRFIIQGSADLRRWSDESAAFTQASSGEIQVTISANPATAHFYRLRSF